MRDRTRLLAAALTDIGNAIAHLTVGDVRKAHACLTTAIQSLHSVCLSLAADLETSHE